MAAEEQMEVVVCSGSLTIARAEELQETLASALTAGGNLMVDCSGATEADLSFVQLLLAARASAAKRGGSVAVKGSEESLLSVVEAAGLTADGIGLSKGTV